MEESLKERMTRLRSATDYKLPLKSYVIVMVDGRSFSRLIKNKYEKPFDDKFIFMMNETAKYVCSNIEGCKLAYAQSDEITFVLTDFDKENTCAFFGYRLTKILSLIPAMASSKFNQLVTSELCNTPCSNDDLKQMILNQKLAEFDCKAFSVDNFNDVYSFLLWRQNDCIKNSKLQTAQTWLSHKMLLNKTADEAISMLKEYNNVDWHSFDNDKKYGRFIYKEKEVFFNTELNIGYDRNIWTEHDAFPIQGNEGRNSFYSLNIIPDIENK